MRTVKDLKILKQSFPAGGVIKFPVGSAEPYENFDRKNPVRCGIVLLGIGETVDRCPSIKSAMDRGFLYTTPNEYSLFASVCVWPIVYVVVQTTEKSAYRNGEIEFAMQYAREQFNVVEFELITVSLGGFGALQYLNTRERASWFKHAWHIMPGGNGNVGQAYPQAAVDAGLKSVFLHAQDDTTALPKQSILMHNEIKRLGGESMLVLYQKGAHAITARPFGSWYDVAIENYSNPWKMAYPAGTGNSSDIVAGQSDLPDKSMYDYFFQTVIVPDKLLYVQGFYQTPSGSVYTKQLEVFDYDGL